MFRSLLRLLAVPDKLAFAGLVRGMSGQVQLGCLSALLRCGALPHLRQWSSVADVAAATGTIESDLLRSLFELARRRGVLQKRGASYRARSALARALAKEPDGPMASMVYEVTTYHLDVLRRLPERLRGEPSVDHLAQFGTVVARSSRIMDHWLGDWIDRLLDTRPVRSVLDLGCGSGAVLAHVAAHASTVEGVGIDIDAKVVEAARQLLDERGYASRFEVRQGDMRDAQSLPDQTFDLITANQNVYYFDAASRPAVWQCARERLADGGCLSIVTAMAGGPMSDYFDLVLGSTAGCHPLPSLDQIENELAAANMRVVRRERLIPGDTVYGLAAEAVRG